MADIERLDGLEVVRGLIRLTSHLSAQTPLVQRMTRLCMELVSILGCDRSSIMLWDGLHYRATYNWGNPPDIAALFTRYKVPKTAPLVQRMLDSEESFIVVNDARTDEDTAAVAAVARIESIVMAALTDGEGASLGFMTAEFNERLGEFDPLRAEIVLGAARLAQSAITSDRAQSSSRRLAGDFRVAVDDERRRLGREIHDEPLQQLFAMCLRLKTIRDRTTDPQLRQELAGLADDCLAASTRLREVVTDIHPDTATVDSLATALQKILRDRADRSDLTTTVKNTATEPTPPATGAILLRIAEQAIQNIVLHAEATEVDVEIVSDHDATSLSISDNGIGFDADRPTTGRLGLISMKERAEDAGGALLVEPRPTGGTLVTVRIPNHE